MYHFALFIGFDFTLMHPAAVWCIFLFWVMSYGFCVVAFRVVCSDPALVLGWCVRFCVFFVRSFCVALVFFLLFVGRLMI